MRNDSEVFRVGALPTHRLAESSAGRRRATGGQTGGPAEKALGWVR
jgi:hypothetical protein